MTRNERDAGTLIDQRGAVYVEFLVAFLPVLVFFLGLIQLALIFTAQSVVQHAALRAARSAVVVLDDDPSQYAGEPRRGDIVYQGGGADEAGVGWMQQASSVLGLDAPVGEISDLMSGGAGPRLSTIQRAAYMPLATLSPSPGTLARTFGLDGGFADRAGNGGRFLTGFLLYNRAAAVVTLRKPDGTLANNVNSRDPVTVRVLYLYYCGIPIASNFLCQSLAQLTGLSRANEAVTSAIDDVTSLDPRRIVRAGDTLRDGLRSAEDRYQAFTSQLEYAAAPELLAPLILTNARFRVLRAQSTLPNQGACYYEQSSCFGGAVEEQ